jgi:hypothetical protein
MKMIPVNGLTLVLGMMMAGLLFFWGFIEGRVWEMKHPSVDEIEEAMMRHPSSQKPEWVEDSADERMLNLLDPDSEARRIHDAVREALRRTYREE